MKSTKDYPDEVINFMRNHPNMYNAVYPIHKRPLVVRTNVEYEFTTITVDQVAAADGNYEVLFLGTGESSLVYIHVKYSRPTSLFVQGPKMSNRFPSESKTKEKCVNNPKAVSPDGPAVFLPII